jgi:hypothetical protein
MTSFQVPNDGFFFWEPRSRSVSRSRPSIENLDLGPLSRILATSVQVFEAVSWVIIIIEIEIPKSKKFSTYPGPPLSTKHTTVVSVCLSGQSLETARTDRQIDTTVALIYKIPIEPTIAKYDKEKI